MKGLCLGSCLLAPACGGCYLSGRQQASNLLGLQADRLEGIVSGNLAAWCVTVQQGCRQASW